MSQLNLNPSPSAIYHICGQVIPYWYYLRVLNLLAISPFRFYSQSNLAFVRSGLFTEGYEILEPVSAADETPLRRDQLLTDQSIFGVDHASEYCEPSGTAIVTFDGC